MTRRTKQIGSVIALALVVAFAFFRPDLPSLRNAPDVTFMTITGKAITMKSLLGKPVLVSFWATSCPSCVKEIPQLIELHRDFTNQGLTIIAVAMEYDIPSRVLQMTREKAIPYPVVLDPQGKLATAFDKVHYTPIHFLIAPDGSVADQSSGQIDSVAMHTAITHLVQ